jgi:sodium transport system permease protein
VRAILTVFLKELRESLRDRRTLMSALLFGPLFGPVLFAVVTQLSIQQTSDAQDKVLSLTVSHAENAPNLVSFLRQNGLQIKTVRFDATQSRSAIRNGSAQHVLLIGSDYGKQLAAGLPAVVQLYSDSSDTQQELQRQRIAGYLQRYGSTVTQLRLLVRGVDPLLTAPLAVQHIDVSTPASRSVLALGAMSALILLSMLMGGLYVAIDATAGERERGSLEALLTVPVPREQLIYGKILASAAFMLLSLILSILAFSVVFRFVGLERFDMSINFGLREALLTVLYCLPLIPLGAALMTVIAAFTRSYREAQTYLGVILLIPTLPLMFASLLGLKATNTLMTVPSLSQHFLITDLLRDTATPASQLVLSVGTSLALGALLTLFAGRLYRREALLG